ncbi:MAG: DUF1501 domain-containing protein [Planctomycetota bacterium]
MLLDPHSRSPFLPRRRMLMQAGALGVAGLNLPTLLRAANGLSGQTPAALNGFGRAKQCILLFMWGGPSQLDTFDPKPLAPDSIRGPFKPIATNVPGMEWSELFPKLAGQADKLAVIRSLNHDDPAHLSSGHTILTGHLPPVNFSDAEPPSERDTPHIGSVMSKVRPSTTAMPSFVTMPWLANHPAAPGGNAPGQHGGWLGRQYDPFLVTGDPNAFFWKVPALTLIDGQSPDRLQHRRELLQSLDHHRRVGEQSGALSQLDFLQQRAFGLLTSATVRGAFDLGKETSETRGRYGRNTHGQCVLLARRLIEHDVPLVSVNWHNDGNNFWDTHGNNFKRLKNDLCPPADRALTALLEDLSRTGRLNETLIVWVGEFGRAPIINGSTGRDHHPRCYSGLMAGGGIRGGQVFGASDQHAAYPADKPVSPHDLVATMYHALGIPSDAVLYDSLNRPHRVRAGRSIEELF